MSKTNVTCSLDADLVARLDAWRAPMNCGRSHAMELLLESLPAVGGSDVALLAEFFGADDVNGTVLPSEPLGVPVDVVLPGEEVTEVVNPEPLPIRQVDELVEAPVSKKSKR